MPARRQLAVLSWSRPPRWALVSAALGTVAGWLAYRSYRQEQVLLELQRRVDELTAQAARVLSPTPGVRVSRPLPASSQLSFDGASFEDAEAYADHTPDSEGPSVGHSPARPMGSDRARTGEGSLHALDALFDAEKHEETVEMVGSPSDADVDAADRLWRRARAYHGLANAALRTGSAAEHKRLMYLAHADAQRALGLQPRLFAAHKWCGILVSETSGFEGTKASIQSSFTVRDHFARAAELNAHDPTSRHLLGLWHFEVASIGWATARIAATLFSTPPSSTYDEALVHLLAAEEIEPGFYKKNQLLIAKAKLKLGDKPGAREWLARAVALDVANADDEAAHAEAAALLKSV